ncbi:MAG: hypothetical protein JRJ58_00215 [Deltaproteobacteria bacterium]|nr:hypothetical protein [Deltaproteobacteria bacterium]
MNQDVQEAIARARAHLHNAKREGLEATRALLEAALHAGAANESGQASLCADLRRALDHWIDSLEQDQLFAMPNALGEPLGRALDAEIVRWEKRSESDEAAPPVLRAFLALRELLWELGMPRDRDEQGASDSSSPQPKEATPRPARQRVQRLDIEDQEPAPKPSTE